MVQPVHFYEVLADGYHSPLTKTQIAELFQAGRLRRNHPCKHLSHKEWRTIDELFPLLKYQPAGSSSYCLPEPDRSFPTTAFVVIALLIAAMVAAILWYCVKTDTAERSGGPPVTVPHSPKTIPARSRPVATTAPAERETNIPSTAPVTVYVQPPTIAASREATFAAPRTIDVQQEQLAYQQRQAEQRQREQIERDRLQTERANLERKAAGHDVIILLDEDHIITFGGMSVRVKIHDNDVTSFDVWINGAWRREVPKEKGITHSGTDETLIYAGGGAHLYYVWEISGTLNHCRLRLRED